MTVRSLSFLLIVVALAGCQAERFRSQRLGEVSYDAAYQAALDVFDDYYAVQSADKASGRIASQPTPVEAAPEMLLTNTEARELAVLRIRRGDDAVWADVRIDIERQVSESYRDVTGLAAHRDVPNQTPAQEDAPLTTEQSLTWRVVGQNYEKERRMLADLTERLRSSP